MNTQLDNNQNIWITIGYEIFAKEGPKALKVEVLAKKVGISKSSFYHFFADLEVFTEQLLEQHLRNAKRLAELEKKCTNIDPDLINLLVKFKWDLLFNRQLRIYRENEAFKSCFEKSNQLVEGSFLNLWTKEMGLDNKIQLGNSLLALVLENFYLQITEENLNYEWLSAYFKEIRTMIAALRKH